MTLKISTIHSAAYDSLGQIIFDVDCGEDHLNITTSIQADLPKNLHNNALLREFLESNEVQPYVNLLSNEEQNEHEIYLRQEKRTKKFSKTLDKLNPLWISSMSESELLELNAWRQAWLDYPNNLDSEEPEDISIF